MVGLCLLTMSCLKIGTKFLIATWWIKTSVKLTLVHMIVKWKITRKKSLSLILSPESLFLWGQCWEWHTKIAKWSLIHKEGNTLCQQNSTKFYTDCFSHAYFYRKYYEVVFNYWKYYYCIPHYLLYWGTRGEFLLDFRKHYLFVIFSESK